MSAAWRAVEMAFCAEQRTLELVLLGVEEWDEGSALGTPYHAAEVVVGEPLCADEARHLAHRLKLGVRVDEVLRVHLRAQTLAIQQQRRHKRHPRFPHSTTSTPLQIMPLLLFISRPTSRFQPHCLALADICLVCYRECLACYRECLAWLP